jgi:hypothetical protein
VRGAQKEHWSETNNTKNGNGNATKKNGTTIKKKNKKHNSKKTKGTLQSSEREKRAVCLLN